MTFDWEKERAEREAKDKQIEALMGDLPRRLKALGVKKVTIEYNGSGDEGFVEPPQFDGKAPDATKIEGGELVLDALERLAYDKLESVHPGWEINEGSFGTITIDVATWKLTGAHSDRYESVEESTF